MAKTDPPLISVIAAVVSRMKRARLINWVQDMFPEVATVLGVKGVRPIEPLLRAMRNYSFRIAQKNIAIGTRMAQKIRDQGVSKSSIMVIHNWSDGDNIVGIPADQNQLKASWGLLNRFVVGYSGNMGRAHEFETILGAARSLKEEKGIIFLFIGSGASKELLQARVKEMNLDNVMFMPYQPRGQLSQSLSVPDVHLISMYSGLEGYIVPSKFYGIAAAGRPSIYIGDCNGEIPLILREGDCGMTFEVGYVQALASYIKELSSDQIKVITMGTNARKLFEANFDKRQALEAWWGLLNE